MKWTIFTPNPRLFSTTEIYYLQQDASTFFKDKIKESPLFQHQNVILVDFKLKNQSIDVNSVQTILSSEVDMTYTGKVMDNFSHILPLVMDNLEAEYLMRKFVQRDFFGPSTTTSSMKFEFNGDSSSIAEDGLGQTMIILMALFAFSSTLAVISMGILCCTKCCSKKRTKEIESEVPDLKLKQTKTEESDHPASPPGILGAFVNQTGEAISQAIITPQRGIHHEFEDTPMSQDSNLTEAKSIYSTTSSKAPLGILSMTNLKKILASPQRKTTAVALYNVGLDDSDVESGDDVNVSINSSIVSKH
jgi:hypothetical protein